MAQKLGWIAVSIALAAISYRVVEQPFRQRQRMPILRLVPTLGFGAAAISAFAVAMIATAGLRARLPHLVALYGPNEFDNELLRDRSWEILNDMAAAEGMGPSKAHRPSDFEATRLWFNPTSNAPKILVVGNSHAKDMFNALHLARDSLGGIEVARFGLGGALSEPQVVALRAAPNYGAADLVLLSFRYEEATVARVPWLLEQLADDGKRVVLLGGTAEFDPLGAQPIFDGYLTREGTIDETELRQLAWSLRSAMPDRFDDRLEWVAAEANVPFLRKADLLCPPPGGACDIVTEEGRKVLFDYGHYTLEGAAFLGRRIAATGWLTASVR